MVRFIWYKSSIFYNHLFIFPVKLTKWRKSIAKKSLQWEKQIWIQNFWKHHLKFPASDLRTGMNGNRIKLCFYLVFQRETNLIPELGTRTYGQSITWLPNNSTKAHTCLLIPRVKHCFVFWRSCCRWVPVMMLMHFSMLSSLGNLSSPSVEQTNFSSPLSWKYSVFLFIKSVCKNSKYQQHSWNGLNKGLSSENLQFYTATIYFSVTSWSCTNRPQLIETDWNLVTWLLVTDSKPSPDNLRWLRGGLLSRDTAALYCTLYLHGEQSRVSPSDQNKLQKHASPLEVLTLLK